MVSRSNISPGGNGRTSVNLPDKPPATALFWRARAQDGANTGPFSSAVKFSVVTPIEIGAPPLKSPVNGVTVDHNPPHLLFGNAPVTGPAGSLSYLVQVATDQAFTQIVFSEQGGFIEPDAGHADGVALTSTTSYWRVRASAGGNTAVSATGVFVPALPGTEAAVAMAEVAGWRRRRWGRRRIERRLPRRLARPQERRTDTRRDTARPTSLAPHGDVQH
jgi:hypothetical protein